MPADNHDHDHGNCNDPSHNHSHNESVGVQIANQMIDMANVMLENGVPPEEIASGLRHGAANFSAYAFFRSEVTPKDPNATVENFIQFFEYYLGVHQPKQEETAVDGFNKLIEQAKGEL